MNNFGNRYSVKKTDHKIIWAAKYQQMNDFFCRFPEMSAFISKYIVIGYSLLVGLHTIVFEGFCLNMKLS